MQFYTGAMNKAVNKEKETIGNIFECPICHKSYSNPTDMAKCVLDCDKKIKENEEKIRKDKLEAERQNRIDEISEAYKKADLAYEEAQKLRDVFAKDYPNTYCTLPRLTTRLNPTVGDDLCKFLFGL